MAICLARCFQCLDFQRDQIMVPKADLVIIGISVGLALGVLIASVIFCGIRWYKKHAHLRRSANDRSATTLPIRTNGLGTSNDFSASISSSIAMQGSENLHKSSHFFPWNHHNKDRVASVSGILRYSYKYVTFCTFHKLVLWFINVISDGRNSCFICQIFIFTRMNSEALLR